jgi:hypothetical protein
MRRATQKDMEPVTRKTARFADAVKNKLSHADLKDHGGHATVTMDWNLNSATVRDRIFLLEINGQKAYIDLEELMSYTRLI